jgi:hypothetical protein
LCSFRMRHLTLEIFLLDQMTLLSVVLGIALSRDTLLTLQLQLITKGGLKRLVLGWLALVMIHSSSSSLLMGRGNAHFACKFFFFFLSIFCQTIFTENFIKIMEPSKYTAMQRVLHQVLCASICSATMWRSGFRNVNRRTLH